MKLTTVLIAGVFALGSSVTLADHGKRNGWHKGHHKHSAHCTHEVRHHRVVIHEYRQPVSRGYRERDRDYRDNYAEVVSVEPVYRYYSEPVQDHSCVQYDDRRAGHNSHTATVLGAVIGGALGHRIGDSHGDPKVAAVAGGLLGASVGRDIDQRARYNRGLLVEGPCRVSNHMETRRELVEYKVAYRYNGRLHYTRMDYDPGEWIKLDVTYTPA